MAAIDPEAEALPEFARHFKATYVATECYSPKFKNYRLVQCHFNIPITHLRTGNEAYHRIAGQITRFLMERFGLRLPVPSLQHGYFELCAVPLLQEIGQEAAPLDMPPATTYFQGTFNLGNGRASLLWPRQMLETREGIATSLRLALDEANIQTTMLSNYKNSNWLFIRMAAVICVCVFLDSVSQAALAALKRPHVHVFT